MNVTDETPTIYRIEPVKLVSTLNFPFLFASMNTLLRTHRWARGKLRDEYTWLVRSMTTNQHHGPVRLEYTRSSSATRRMDYDGLVSSSKVILDALVLAKVIVDDNQEIIAERSYEHVLTSRKVATFTVIKITDL